MHLLPSPLLDRFSRARAPGPDPFGAFQVGDGPTSRAYLVRLLTAFEAAPEAARLEGDTPFLELAALLAHASVTVHGVAPTRWTAAELDELLYGWLPSRCAIDAADARDVIVGVRALLAFLDRTAGLGDLAGCLRSLDPGRLTQALQAPRAQG